MKYVGVKLRKYVQNLYSENYIMLMEEIKQGIKKWRNIPCSCTGTLNVVNKAILPRSV